MDYSYLQTPGFKALLKEISKLQEITSYRNAASTLQTTRAMFELEAFQNAVKSINNSLSPIFDNVQNIGEIVRSSTIPAETLCSLSNRYSDLFKGLDFRVDMPAVENLNRLDKSLAETLLKTMRAYSARPADIDRFHNPDASGHIDTDYANLNWDQESPNEFYSFDEQTLSQIEESIGTLPNECKKTDDSGKILVPKNVIKSIIFYLVNLLTLLSFALDVYNSHQDSLYKTEMLEKVDDVVEYLHDILQEEQHQSRSIDELDDRLDNLEESIRKPQDTVEPLLNSLEDEP